LKQTKHFSGSPEKRSKQRRLTSVSTAEPAAEPMEFAMSTFTPSMRAAYRSFCEYRTRRRAVRMLGAMEDGFLKDIGIGRAEIHSVVQNLPLGHAGRMR
jgi:uncharacterized protein YjiS (DUF1127 family)